MLANNPRGIGISRRIKDSSERKRIRDILNDFNIPNSSGVVVRTAAENKTREDFTRDYTYLVNLWNDIRHKTLSSRAPSMIYEDDSIVKKSVKEYCDNDVSELVIEGDEAFNEAETFIKTLSYDRDFKITKYRGKTPLFVKYGVEEQIASLLESRVDLPSGASLILQQTEALVSIDVNSGRVTSEASIEETALKTNVEAAREIARQVRLRNLSGLIVVDFIDMFKISNRKAVEKELRDELIKDKAKVQTSRISQFGLLEISRQRTNPSLFEMSAVPCTNCSGTGFTRSVEYYAMTILRGVANVLIEANLVHNKAVCVYSAFDVSNYILNYKRIFIDILEKQCNVKVFFQGDVLLKNDRFKIDYSSEQLMSILALQDSMQDLDISKEASQDVSTDDAPERAKKQPRDRDIKRPRPPHVNKHHQQKHQRKFDTRYQDRRVGNASGVSGLFAKIKNIFGK